MAEAKEIFLKDKTLSDKWSGWTHGPDAAKVFAFADAELLAEPDLNSDMIRGAKMYRRILENLAESDPPEPEYPKSGLEHDLDPQPRTVKPTE